MTSRSVTGSTRACTCASCVGHGAGSGSRCSKIWSETQKPCLRINSTIRQAHQQGGGGAQREDSEDPAPGHSPGDLNTKIHRMTDVRRTAIRITPVRRQSMPTAIALLERREAKAVIADKVCDSAKIVAQNRGRDRGKDFGRDRKSRRSGRHPTTAPALEAEPKVRPRTLQRTQSHRTLLQPPQTHPPLQQTIRRNRRGLPCTALACVRITRQRYADTASSIHPQRGARPASGRRSCCRYRLTMPAAAVERAATAHVAGLMLATGIMPPRSRYDPAHRAPRSPGNG